MKIAQNIQQSSANLTEADKVSRFQVEHHEEGKDEGEMIVDEDDHLNLLIDYDSSDGDVMSEYDLALDKLKSEE